MAKALVLKFRDADFSFFPEKVDRTRLYGFIDIEALDGKGQKCQLATLADDGRTVIGMGGTAFAQLSPEGEWLEKSKLKPVDPEGRPITPSASSYSAPVPLTAIASIEDYLSHNIKSVYVLRGEGDFSGLLTEIKKGTIYTFPYSYRGGLEADVGFLLADPNGNAFLAVGQPTNIHFVGLEQAAALTEEDTCSEEDVEESVDFSMM
ncbi:MAG: hypothetical protein M5U26_23030 [Planctomycetota bacterium]|nr:hypothetical protein [Planctomycetota bacterium]